MTTTSFFGSRRGPSGCWAPAVWAAQRTGVNAASAPPQVRRFHAGIPGPFLSGGRYHTRLTHRRAMMIASLGAVGRCEANQEGTLSPAKPHRIWPCGKPCCAGCRAHITPTSTGGFPVPPNANGGSCEPPLSNRDLRRYQRRRRRAPKPTKPVPSSTIEAGSGTGGGFVPVATKVMLQEATGPFGPTHEPRAPAQEPVAPH